MLCRSAGETEAGLQDVEQLKARETDEPQHERGAQASCRAIVVDFAPDRPVFEVRVDLERDGEGDYDGAECVYAPAAGSNGDGDGRRERRVSGKPVSVMACVSDGPTVGSEDVQRCVCD